MLGLNHLLTSAGIELEGARLVRHQDTQAVAGKTPHDLWIAADGRFELYQRIQGKERFKGAKWVISFVATPLNETLFVGAYAVIGAGKVPKGTLDPIGGHDVSGLHFYDLCPHEPLKGYAGRILVDWGLGFRSWVQRADRQNKPILELRRDAIEPDFPGYMRFSWPINDLPAVPQAWRAALSAVTGIYLLVCKKTGRQYVGSAYGSGGFWARWESYFRTGHGGNEGMKLAPDSEYTVAILEVAASTSNTEEIVHLENRWKEKLFSRHFGFNRN